MVPSCSCITLTLILGTAFIVLIFMGLDGAWVSFGLFAPYPVWLIVALILNAEFSSKFSYTAWKKAHSKTMA